MHQSAVKVLVCRGKSFMALYGTAIWIILCNILNISVPASKSFHTISICLLFYTSLFENNGVLINHQGDSQICVYGRVCFLAISCWTGPGTHIVSHLCTITTSPFFQSYQVDVQPQLTYTKHTMILLLNLRAICLRHSVAMWLMPL